MNSLVRLSVLVIVLAGAVGLAWSNPTMDDYLQFVEHELHRALDRMEQRASSGERQLIQGLVRSQGKNLIEGMVRPATVRKNWGLLSRYETHLLDTTVVMLGIGGRFIPISGVEEAKAKLKKMAF
ncbi:MAG: DUF4359 domain-containing protein [Nitrospira sp.]|nr:DUF4359 domain-containing protein [Nitrospira sp.]